jgi:hypothetical protein
VRDGWRRKSLPGIDFQMAAGIARYGEKLFGVSQFFIRCCTANLCGQNGSGCLARLWYTRSLVKRSVAKVRDVILSTTHRATPCIVRGMQVAADLSKPGFDLRAGDTLVKSCCREWIAGEGLRRAKSSISRAIFCNLVDVWFRLGREPFEVKIVFSNPPALSSTPRRKLLSAIDLQHRLTPLIRAKSSPGVQALNQPTGARIAGCPVEGRVEERSGNFPHLSADRC